MNRQKMLRIVSTAIQKGMEQKFTREQIAEGIVNRIEFALEEELEQQDSGVVEFPIRPDPDKPNLDYVPPAPGPTGAHDGSSLILATGSSAPQPVRLRPESASTVKSWQEPDLREYIYARTPPTLEVVPRGSDRPVTLYRNVEVLFGTDLIRLSYGFGDRVAPTPSSGPNRDGAVLSPIAIDQTVFTTFNCWDLNQPVADKLDALRSQAVDVFRPMPARLISSTPISSGTLRFDLSMPHDEV